ncbi:MAG: type II secretion system F family protein [Candidatus Gottesmanbacteria bacterium]
MAKYSYILVNQEGKKESGQTDAFSRDEAANQIKRPGWFITSLDKKINFNFDLPFFKRSENFSSFERIMFTDHLASMIRSGTPIIEALEIYNDEKGKKRKLIIDNMVKQIQKGKQLSTAMTLYPQTFSPLYISLVQSGELTGRLDETIDYLSKDLRREYEFNENIRSALFYPVLVLIVALLVVMLLIMVVIPKVLLLTKELGNDMPPVTRMVASVADLLTRFGPLIIFLIFLGMILMPIIFSIPAAKRKLDPYLLKMPLVGSIIRKYILSRFLQIVGSCLKYGIPLTTIFPTIGNVVSNEIYRQACNRVEAKIIRGLSLSEALNQELPTVFPRVIVRTLKGGEKTGSVDMTCLRLSRFFEDDIDRQLKRVTDLIEPILVVFLGIVVAVIALGAIAPIYQLTSSIR